ncbi:epoxyqueuosine reductase QueH [Thiospirochaeta perfilievii]|uniref:Epoxyqueuosine reductase QueH n=1 Tax=Thiospirochaeta perfilievii TaxID=252967 RepID=A0A5C1QEF8_9SPIO|nr:epoxyqueuosine reductase QueH [Thiospirochaeta perfilievii]QEN05971.1 epoxyqueuosine reductase QueH [Thiospirochaeta perfilievii]
MDVLLHVCCGPCAVGSIPKIEEHNVTLYFSNSNINSYEEFEKRYETAVTVSNYYKESIIKDKYEHNRWSEHIKGLEGEPEKGKRCLKCFEYSFIQSAKKAKELGIDNFTSTLTISPHKNSKIIMEIGERVAKEYGLNYVMVDFCKENGFKLSTDLSKELGLYRQKYCGCEYSIWF